MATSKKIETSHASLLERVEEYFRARGKSIKSDLEGKTHEEVLQTLQAEIDDMEETDRIWKVMYNIKDRFPLWKNSRDSYELHTNLRNVGYPGHLPHIDTIKSIDIKDSKLELIHEQPGDQDYPRDESGHGVQLAGHIVGERRTYSNTQRRRAGIANPAKTISPSGNSGYVEPVDLPGVSGQTTHFTINSSWTNALNEAAELYLQDARISTGRGGLAGSSGTSGTVGVGEIITGSSTPIDPEVSFGQYFFGNPPDPSPQREG